MTPKLYIAVPFHNRAKIARECIPTIREGIISGHDTLAIYDDGSAEEMPMDLFSVADVAYPFRHIGIECQRRRHFKDFAERRDRMDWTHLYLTDADAPHDPAFRTELLRLQSEHGGAPICGYNTQSHVRILGNTIIDDPASEVIWRRAAPGVSYLLTAEHVAKVCAWLDRNPQEHWDWDWTVPAILGNRFAVTRTSYVEHIGVGGYHHPPAEGYEGGDRALNPTAAVAAKRAEIVAKLKEGA